jgi:hypothetical protein
MRFERGAGSISVDPAGNQVELAGRSQVIVMRSSNSGTERIALDTGWEGERFLMFRLLPKPGHARDPSWVSTSNRQDGRPAREARMSRGAERIRSGQVLSEILDPRESSSRTSTQVRREDGVGRCDWPTIGSRPA